MGKTTETVTRKSKTRLYRVYFKDGTITLLDAENPKSAEEGANYWKRRERDYGATVDRVELL